MSNETMQSLKQTGRTTRMLQYAVMLASKGKSVTVYVTTEDYERITAQMTELYDSIEHEENSSVAVFKNTDLETKEGLASFYTDTGGQDSNSDYTFIDHALIEKVFGAMLDDLHEFDAYFRIGISGVMTKR